MRGFSLDEIILASKYPNRGTGKMRAWVRDALIKDLVVSVATGNNKYKKR